LTAKCLKIADPVKLAVNVQIKEPVLKVNAHAAVLTPLMTPALLTPLAT
jgi:hypothetical protein